MTEIDHEIRALTGARAVAASVVVATHLIPTLGYLTPWADPAVPYLMCGALAVDFFFLLSGFIITHRYLESMAQPSWESTRHFWVLRFARIWPVHAAVVLAFVAYHHLKLHFVGAGLEADNVGIGNIVANLLMFQQFPPSTPINPPAWSLAPEFGAYLLFPVLALGLARVRSAPVALGSAAVILVVAAATLSPVVAHDVNGYRSAWLRIAFAFVAGALLAVGWRLLPAVRRSRAWDLGVVGAALGIVVVCWWDPPSNQFDLPIEVYPFLGLIVLACAASTGPVARFLGQRFVEWGGRISYSVYVTHFLVLIFMYNVLVSAGTADQALPVKIVLLAVVIAVVIGVGALSYYVVEEPARKYFRRREKRRRATRQRSAEESR